MKTVTEVKHLADSLLSYSQRVTVMRCRVFTAPLFHMSLLHVAFNMMAFVPISAAQVRRTALLHTQRFCSSGCASCSQDIRHHLCLLQERMHGTFQLALNLLALDLLSSAAFVTASYLLASW